MSSLVFVGFHDTLVIPARLLASALVSSTIVLLQMDMIRVEDENDLIGDEVGRSREDSRCSADDMSLDQLDHIGGPKESPGPERLTE